MNRKSQPAPKLNGLPAEAAEEIRSITQVVYRLASRIDAYDAGIPQSSVKGLVEELASKVPQSRRIMTQLPLEGGRDLRADLTLRDIGGDGSGVTSLNGLTGDVVLVAGTDINITPAGQNITIDATGGGGGITEIDPGSNVGPTVTFQTGTSGTDFGLSNPAADVIQIDLPIADATNTGKLSNTDWIYFNIKPLVVAFYVNNGSAADPVAADFAPRAGSLAACKILVIASDAAVDLTFDIEKNGVSVFTAPPTVAMGTAAMTLVDETASLTGTLTIAQDDIFKLAISSGSASWIVSIKLET